MPLTQDGSTGGAWVTTGNQIQFPAPGVYYASVKCRVAAGGDGTFTDTGFYDESNNQLAAAGATVEALSAGDMVTFTLSRTITVTDADTFRLSVRNLTGSTMTASSTASISNFDIIKVADTPTRRGRCGRWCMGSLLRRPWRGGPR